MVPSPADENLVPLYGYTAKNGSPQAVLAEAKKHAKRDSFIASSPAEKFADFFSL
jgi:hypothetical protein